MGSKNPYCFVVEIFFFTLRHQSALRLLVCPLAIPMCISDVFTNVLLHSYMFYVQTRLQVMKQVIPEFVGESYDAAAFDGCLTMLGQILAQPSA